jgi:hypothetical protein
VKIRRLVVAGLFAAGVVAVPATAAFASNGVGPGSCDPPGSIVSEVAKVPDMSVKDAWPLVIGLGETPGQGVSSLCTPAGGH